MAENNKESLVYHVSFDQLENIAENNTLWAKSTIDYNSNLGHGNIILAFKQQQQNKNKTHTLLTTFRV